MFIESDAAVRTLSIGEAAEVIEYALGPRGTRLRREFENRAAGGVSTDHGRAVEIALAVQSEARGCVSPVGTPGKAVENLLFARCRAGSESAGTGH